MSARSRYLPRGFTLVELLVAVAVLSFVSVIIYGAFAGMKRSKEGLARVNDRYHEGRTAMSRMTRELESSYISAHGPIDLSIQAWKTAWVGAQHGSGARIDFNCFCNQRLDRDAHESDQADISYFVVTDPDHSGVSDLVRRVKTRLDVKPGKGGRVEVLASDVDLFEAEYLDPVTGNWVESWDSVQAAGQPNRIPLQVRLHLVLNGGRRQGGGDRAPIDFRSSVTLPIQRPLTFGAQ